MKLGSISSKGLPIYKRIRNEIAAQIERGELPPNAKLPSERALSEQQNISRMTARHIYIKLEEEGLVYRHGNRGCFVAEPRLRYALMRSVSFVDNVETEGGPPGTEIIHKEIIRTPDWIRQRLRLPAREKVYFLRRLRKIGSKPAMIETMYMSVARFPDLFRFELSGSLLTIWDELYDIEVGSVEATLSGTRLSKHDAKILDTEPLAHGFSLVQTIFDVDKEPLGVEHQHWRNDVAEFSFSVDFH